MACILGSLVSKVIDKVWDKTIVTVGRELNYVIFYKSNVTNMKAVDHDLEKKQQIVEESVKQASNNLRIISEEAKEWLQEVNEAHEEVRRLFNTYEQDQAMRMSCIGGQILNPIARHKLGRKATKKKQTIEDLLLNKPKVEDISYPPPPPGIVDYEATVSAIQQTDNGVFRSSRWEEIVEEIMTALKDNTTNIIGLHGMGGVGKSTMITEVYDRVKKQCMFDEVAKVLVKVKPEIRRIQEEIAFAFGLKLESESPAVRAEQLRERLLKTEKKKTVLIVLDDVWEVIDLREVGIPSAGNDQVQIKLLLSSRDEYVLSDKMGARNPIHLDVLSDADALRMFKFFVGGGAEDVVAEKVTQTATKCRGLPIVIEVTAKALKNRALDEWDRILKRLDNVDVLEKLKVSYDYLPSKESKDLFLLCGIVRGPRVQVRDLLKYSFGLGLYEAREDIHSLVDAESELEELLSGLEAASMLLKRDDSLYVNIHDHMRDLAIRIVDKDRLEWVNFTLRDSNYKLPHKFEAPKLELLLSYCKEEEGSLQVPHLFFKEMNKLYVLEFTNLRGALPSPTELVDHLRNLGTLCLHNCSLDDISMIGELKGLQILSFRGSDIRKLPIQLRGLIALKMLDLSNCTKLTEIEPNVLGSLTKVEELNMQNSFKDWEVDQEDGTCPPSNARLIELKNMSLLSNLRIQIPSTSMLPKDDHLFSSKLCIYEIILGDDWDWVIDAGRKESRVLMLKFDNSPDFLQRDWVQATLRRVEVLHLNGSLDGKCESVSELCINGFECLKYLGVSNCPSIRHIVSSNFGSKFSDLESLYLNGLESLEKICNGETFNKLKVISIFFCDKLTHLFDFFVLERNLELAEIIVVRCKEIHCIVIDEDDESYDVVMLSKLQRLKLQHLPKFQAFCVPQNPQPLMNVLFSGKKVVFSCLEYLEIEELDELEYIWHPTDPPTDFGHLRFLHVDECHKLVSVINSIASTVSLESLTINKCASMKHVFDLRYDQLLYEVEGFQLLKDITIKVCHQMEAIVVMMGKEETHQQVAAIQYSSLKELEVMFCRKLKTFCWYYCGKSSEDMVASSTTEGDIVTSCDQQVHVNLPFFNPKETFPCLETLNLVELEALTQIWPHDEVVAAQVSFYNLKQVQIGNCQKLSEVLPSTMIVCLQRLECIEVWGCELVQSIIVKQCRRADMTITKFTLPCLRKMRLAYLPDLDGFYSSSASLDFPSLETLIIHTCSKVKTLFIPMPPTTSLVGSNVDSNGVEAAAFFGYGDTQAKLFPNLKFLELNNLENFSGIWKMESDYEDRLTLQQELRGKVDVCELCMQKLESLNLEELPKLELSIFISDKKCIKDNNNNKLPPPYKEYILLFPSLQELKVQRCSMVKLFDSDSSTNQVQLDSVLTVIEQFSISLEKAIPSPLRLLAAEYNNGIATLKIEEHEMMRFGQKQHLHLNLHRCNSSSSSCMMNFLPLSSPSFCNVLTRLTVAYSDGLEHVLTPVGATSLLHLTYLTIKTCDNMKEVVVDDNENGGEEEGKGDIIREIITFCHLKQLTLEDLQCLESFSSVESLDLNFPFLEELTIDECPNMRFFSNSKGGGILTTPKLRQLNWITWGDEDKIQLTEDLNTIIQQKYAAE